MTLIFHRFYYVIKLLAYYVQLKFVLIYKRHFIEHIKLERSYYLSVVDALGATGWGRLVSHLRQIEENRYPTQARSSLGQRFFSSKT